MEWLEPWWPTENETPEFLKGLRKRLELEVSPGHMMYGLPVRLIRRDNCSDDALFEILDGSGRIAVVHLTWEKSPQSPPWPLTMIYADLAAFAEGCMLAYQEEWNELEKDD